MQTWPNGSTGNGSADQVPTELHYSNTRTRERTWGYEIPKFNKDIEPLKWFKLLLQDNPKPAMISHPGDLLLGLKNMTLSPESSVRDNSSNSSSSSCYIPPTVTPAQKTKLQLRTLKMQPIQVIADFLSNVRKVSVDSIERAYERDWTETKIFYVLTVPAIWTDPAKNLMVQAAENAGFGTHRVDFSLVSEPEAAAGLF